MWCCFELAHILRSRSETCRSMQQRALHAVRQSLRAPTGSTLWPCQLAVAAGWDSRCRRAVACSSHHTVPIPLSRRPADCVEPLSRILLWRQNVLQSIQRVGDGLQQLDGGPSQQELQTELRWLMEDVLEAVRAGASSNWQPTSTWQQLEADLAAEQRHIDRQAASANTTSTSSSSSCEGSSEGPLAWLSWEAKLRMPVAELEQLWQQRMQERVPYQYLAATAHWRDLVLAVGPGVLIPRPETEQMVDWAAEAVAAAPHLAAATWLDLGTGSGALAVGVARMLQKRCKDAQVWAVDVSPVAAAYARYNADACSVGGLVHIAQGSWYEPVGHLAGRVGGIVSNPPYIPREQMAGLQAEVGRHEPTLALDGGEGPGLDSLEVICSGAVQMLMPGGYIILETAGGEQAARVCRLLDNARDREGQPAFTNTQVHEDYYGVARFVSGTRSGSC